MSPRRQLRKLWPDVPRLLTASHDFASADSPDTHYSVPAFMAWKALLIVVRGENEETEKRQCIESIHKSLSAYPKELRAPLAAFAKAADRFRSTSRNEMAEWFCSPGDRNTSATVTATLKAIQSLQRVPSMPDEQLPGLSDELGAVLYNMRSAVIAHAAVFTRSNLFDVVVPAFTRLVAGLAMAGWAGRAGASWAEAEEVANVRCR